jgi:hypothetical protein
MSALRKPRSEDATDRACANDTNLHLDGPLLRFSFTPIARGSTMQWRSGQSGALSVKAMATLGAIAD